MGHRRGESRQQAALFPVMLDELVAADSLVRVIDAWVGSLQLKALGFGKAQAQVMGAPPYDPADLLKLYVWGYLSAVRSSRALERECRRNVECMWLLGRLANVPLGGWRVQRAAGERRHVGVDAHAVIAAITVVGGCRRDRKVRTVSAATGVDGARRGIAPNDFFRDHAAAPALDLPAGVEQCQGNAGKKHERLAVPVGFGCSYRYIKIEIKNIFFILPLTYFFEFLQFH